MKSKNIKLKQRSKLSQLALSCTLGLLGSMAPLHAKSDDNTRPMEYLDRGLVALERSDGVYLSWRMLGADNRDIGFNLYRNGEQINTTPITTSTNYLDEDGSASDTYSVETVLSTGNEVSNSVSVWELQSPYLSPTKSKVPFKRIPLPEAPQNDDITYTPGDMSVGDLDGDGQYELIFEWEPSSGLHSYVEAIDLDGNSLWRIDCGPNTTKQILNIMVYDLNEDGKAEVAMTTGPGTIDGTGSYLSQGPAADDDDTLVIERTSGHMMSDPSYITLFNGETGKEMATVNYWPAIGATEDMEATWGDDYGKRSASKKAAVLYDAEQGPLLVFARGIYSRIGMAAYKWDGANSLTTVWKFDSDDEGNEGYAGQGNHSVAVGDVDNDGSDELTYGAMAIDNDGSGLYTTQRGHGDAHAIGDLIPDRDGLEFFQPHENSTYGIDMRDAATGEILWEVLSSDDVGRAWAADVTADYRGSEVAAVGLGTFDAEGNSLDTDYNSYNQPIYFDGDVQQEMRSGSNISGSTRLLTGWYYGAATVHDSKNDANLVADILGDWREEVIFPNVDNTELLLISTWIETEHKNYTLMHDPMYRMNVVVQKRRL
ncbi:rhamnogalacturonan lyase [Vibrio sp. CDRSL-10 TSBA]